MNEVELNTRDDRRASGGVSVHPFSDTSVVLCDTSDRIQWLKARTQGIGASEAPAVLGLSPYASALSVYQSKILPDESNEESEILKWGNILEPVILEELGKELDCRVSRRGILLRSKEWPWMLCTLDGIAHMDELVPVEAKSTYYKAREWEIDGVPEYVEVQQQQQMAVTGASRSIAVVLLRGNALRWKEVARNEAFIQESLVPAGKKLWDLIVRGESPPPADNSKATADALKRLYPKDNGEAVALTGPLVEAHEKRVDLKLEEKRVKDDLQAVDNQIKAAIGKATFGELPDGSRYNYRVRERNGFTVAPTTFRQLTLERRKD